MTPATAVLTGVTGADGLDIIESTAVQSILPRGASKALGHNLRFDSDFVAKAFAAAGSSDWQHLVINDDSLIRPADRPATVGDATKAWEPFGWRPTKSFHEIVVAMVDSDLTQERDA